MVPCKLFLVNCSTDSIHDTAENLSCVGTKRTNDENDTGPLPIITDSFKLAGLNLRLLIYPEGAALCSKENYISVYLASEHGCFITYRLILKCGTKAFSKVLCHKFNAKDIWGIANFAPRLDDVFYFQVEVLENPALFSIETPVSSESGHSDVWIVQNLQSKLQWITEEDFFCSEPLQLRHVPQEKKDYATYVSFVASFDLKQKTCDFYIKGALGEHLPCSKLLINNKRISKGWWSEATFGVESLLCGRKAMPVDDELHGQAIRFQVMAIPKPSACNPPDMRSIF